MQDSAQTTFGAAGCGWQTTAQKRSVPEIEWSRGAHEQNEISVSQRPGLEVRYEQQELKRSRD
jgi:hypothetical protein